METDMTGKDLRRRIDEISDLMNDVEYFLNKTKKITVEAVDLIQTIRESTEDLFYMIPLNKKIDEGD
jgi:archaellum component FlaC